MNEIRLVEEKGKWLLVLKPEGVFYKGRKISNDGEIIKRFSEAINKLSERGNQSTFRCPKCKHEDHAVIFLVKESL